MNCEPNRSTCDLYGSLWELTTDHLGIQRCLTGHVCGYQIIIETNQSIYSRHWLIDSRNISNGIFELFDALVLHGSYIAWLHRAPPKRLFVRQCIRTNNKENSKVPCYCPFVRRNHHVQILAVSWSLSHFPNQMTRTYTHFFRYIFGNIRAIADSIGLYKWGSFH